MSVLAILLGVLVLMPMNATNNEIPENFSIKDTCVGGTVKFSAIPLNQTCTEPRTRLCRDRKPIIENNGLVVSLNNVTISHQGWYAVDTSCRYEGKKTAIFLLRPMCDEITAYKGAKNVDLFCPPATNLYDADYLEYDVNFQSPDSRLKLISNGTVTGLANKTFEGRLTWNFKTNTVKLSNVRISDAGQYTCIRKWIKDRVYRFPSQFTYTLEVSLPSTVSSTAASTSGAQVTSGQTTTESNSKSTNAGHSTGASKSAQSRIATRITCLILGILVGLVAVYAR